jgi:hypothetical protein
MMEGNSKKRGFMLARHGRATTASFQTAHSGAERPVSRVRGLIVNLRGTILEIPENWQTVALPGYDHQDGCNLSPQGPHTESGIAFGCIRPAVQADHACLIACLIACLSSSGALGVRAGA